MPTAHLEHRAVIQQTRPDILSAGQTDGPKDPEQYLTVLEIHGGTLEPRSSGHRSAFKASKVSENGRFFPIECPNRIVM